MKKEDNRMMKTMSYLALQLQNSKKELINAVASGLLIDYEKPRESSSKSRSEQTEDAPRYSEETLKLVVRKNKELAKFLGINPVQSVIFVAGFSLNINGGDFDTDKISHFFDLNSMEFLPLRPDFEQLVRRKFFLQDRERKYRSNPDYLVNPHLKSAVMNNDPFDENALVERDFDRYKFTKTVSDLIESRKEADAPSYRLFKSVEELEEDFKELKFVEKVRKIIKSIGDRVLFYEICDDYLTGCSRSSDVECTLRDIYNNPSMQFRIGKVLMDKEHELQNFGLIELKDAEMYSDASMELTEKGKQLFLEEDFDLFSSEKAVDGNKDLIYPDKIAEKSLFYDASLKKQLALFQDNLTEEKFAKLQKRLEEKAMPKGVIALFHGEPGTGKTETAMQIARATGRAVCHVDISAAKTCWYGESQKLVKGIFTKYAKMCKKSKQKPILLFNEADALFSSRQNINNVHGSSSVAQTENAIQNILLEEMEKLDGIMIATTNLTDNLDSAFARRFLFKIKFGQPTVEAKQLIWKSKLEWLSNEDSRVLAAKYDFSGGEIDNIVRKITMSEVLDGTRPDLAGIEELCRHEKIGGREKGGIGFKG
jgi:hypothetical protein